MQTTFVPPEVLPADSKATVFNIMWTALREVGIELPEFTQSVFFDLTGITIVELPQDVEGPEGIKITGADVIRAVRHYRYAESLTEHERKVGHTLGDLESRPIPAGVTS